MPSTATLRTLTSRCPSTGCYAGNARCSQSPHTHKTQLLRAPKSRWVCCLTSLFLKLKGGGGGCPVPAIPFRTRGGGNEGGPSHTVFTGTEGLQCPPALERQAALLHDTAGPNAGFLHSLPSHLCRTLCVTLLPRHAVCKVTF